MLYVFARITAKAGQRDALLDMFVRHAQKARTDKGCIEYRAAVDADEATRAIVRAEPLGPDTYLVREEWESATDLKAHVEGRHMKEYVAQTKDLVASRVIFALKSVP